MNRLHVCILLSVFAVIAARAEETNTPTAASATSNAIPTSVTSNALPTSITIDGTTYQDVRWGRLTPSTVTIFHRTGIETMPLWKLPLELQKRFGYDPQKAAGYQAEIRAAQNRGRIGETRAQIMARYGKPDDITDEGRAYSWRNKGGFIIGVRFYQDKAEKLLFVKNNLDESTEMSENEIATFLKACGGERRWEPRGAVSMTRGWLTEDGTILAIYSTDPSKAHELTVESVESIERAKSEKKSEEDKNLQGF